MTTSPDTDDKGGEMGNGTYTQTWTSVSPADTRPIFSKELIESITKEATRWQRFKLLFRPSRYVKEGDFVVRYKEMNGVTYVMKKGTRL